MFLASQPEHFGDWYTGFGAQKMCPKNFMRQKSIKLLLCLKYVSVHLMHLGQLLKQLKKIKI